MPRDSYAKEQSAVLVDFLKAGHESNPGVHMKAHLVSGDARDKLLDCAAKWRASAVVVGAHGKGAIKRAFLGSVSDYLSHHSPVPVVIVHVPKA